MNTNEMIYFAVLEYVSKTSKATNCIDFVKEVLNKEKDCRESLLNVNGEPAGRVNDNSSLKGGF